MALLARLEAWRLRRRYHRYLRWHVRHHGRISDGGLDFGLVLRAANLSHTYSQPEFYWPLLWAYGFLWKGRAVPPVVVDMLKPYLPPERLAAVLAVFQQEAAAIKRV